MKRGVWRKARPIVRPGDTPRMPAGWPGLARWVRKRDGWLCRRCDHPAPRAHIDHLVPRKLLVGSEVAARNNLAALCGPCHAWKTQTLEPKLYRGDVLAFDQFLAVIATSGPVPSSSLKARAYRRLKEALYGAQVPRSASPAA